MRDELLSLSAAARLQPGGSLTRARRSSASVFFVYFYHPTPPRVQQSSLVHGFARRHARLARSAARAKPRPAATRREIVFNRVACCFVSGRFGPGIGGVSDRRMFARPGGWGGGGAEQCNGNAGNVLVSVALHLEEAPLMPTCLLLAAARSRSLCPCRSSRSLIGRSCGHDHRSRNCVRTVHLAVSACSLLPSIARGFRPTGRNRAAGNGHDYILYRALPASAASRAQRPRLPRRPPSLALHIPILVSARFSGSFVRFARRTNFAGFTYRAIQARLLPKTSNPLQLGSELFVPHSSQMCIYVPCIQPLCPAAGVPLLLRPPPSLSHPGFPEP